MHERGDLRRIDPSLGLGLHELGSPGGSFQFQLTHVKKQTEDILLNLESLVENTIAKAPMREGDFRLGRSAEPDLTHEEVKWERAMYSKWGPSGSDDYVPVCKRIQIYQYPLKAFKTDLNPRPNNKDWGFIDLLGIGANFLPLPNELKKRESAETPLRMLVQAAAYGYAIQKVWPNLKEHWEKAMARFEGSPTEFPATLDRVTLICVAPADYWNRTLGLVDGTKEGQFPSDAWSPFWELEGALKKWFDFYFVAVDGSWDGNTPTITAARILNLRNLSTTTD